jgi:hypothetical protein
MPVGQRQIREKDILNTILIARDKIGCVAIKNDVLAIAADRGHCALAVAGEAAVGYRELC